jgi:creatinine amidohydrolase/Fe(II)-dependent formamide hydrolase-like protein
MPEAPHLLAHAKWPAIRDLHYNLAVLPWGATEAHNTRLPYATDTIQVEAISDLAAARANAQGAKVVVLPTIPFGVQTGQRSSAAFSWNSPRHRRNGCTNERTGSRSPHGTDPGHHDFLRHPAE